MSEPTVTELESFLFLFPNKTAEEFEAWKADPANATDYESVQQITINTNPSTSEGSEPPPEEPE